MSAFSDLWDSLSDYAKEKFNQFTVFSSKGMAPQHANRMVKLSSSPDPYQQKGLKPWEALAIYRYIRDQRSGFDTAFPTQRSQHVRSSLATQTTWISKWDYRYLWDYTFQVKDIATGEIRDISLTLGTRRTGRLGNILQMMEEQVAGILALPPDIPKSGDLSQNMEYIPGSIQITGFYRTANR